ncbi:MAG: chlorophyllase/cutinase-like alpha/beta fold protein [Chryseobacterium jejuense]|uniref:poly(ethylene terephthalate) hydrolase family protein n=1 Tax=Chryseobacterium jejuense TaxID=445960 RepID=UPI003D0BBD94
MRKSIVTTVLISLLMASCQGDEEIMSKEPTGKISEMSASKSVIFPSKGAANIQYGKLGPHQVSTNAVVGDCNQLAGLVIPILQTIGILDQSIKCSNNFPYGFESPVSTAVYYPSDISNMNKLPVVNFVGGILSSQGNYDQMVRLWASYGFIVVISSNFINSMPDMHILGAANVANLNKDPQSPLFGKADLSKMIIAGHSAGGGATLLTSSISETAMKLIDPDLKIVAALPIEPGPVAIGSTVKVPTFTLTGRLDFVVPADTWPNLWQSNLIKNVPAWSATATTATHFSPTMDISKNEFAGISVAWLKYMGYNDSEAKSYFVGPQYKLKEDIQFIGLFTPPVKRNAKADLLQ